MVFFNSRFELFGEVEFFFSVFCSLSFVLGIENRVSCRSSAGQALHHCAVHISPLKGFLILGNRLVPTI
jgi:hypothetical protein